MYLNNFCFVLILVTVSANYVHEELPLYLSDDILISKIPSISKRSVPDATHPEKTIPINTKESKHGRNVEEEIENEEESGLVFIPSFGRRTRRSTPDSNQESSQKTQDGNVEDKSSNNNEQNNKKKNANTETEKEAESGLVFLPSFGRRTRRSTEIDNQKSNDQDKLDSATTHGQNSQKKNQNSETEKEAESGLVFLPSFGRRTRRSTETDHEKINNKQETNDGVKPVSEHHEQNINNKKQNSEVEKEAESGLVFLPSFGRRTRRSAILKEEDLSNSESNIVFLPSFRRNGFRRFRREVEHLIKRSADKKTEDNERKTESLTTERNEELSDSDAVNGQESGLVFLPSFGRRSRRSLEETRIPSLNYQKNHQDVSTTTIRTEKDNQNDKEKSSTPLRIKRDITTEKPDENKNTKNSEDDESEEESGLVFIPSFGRRQRRDTSSTDISVKSGNSQSLPKKKEDTVPKKTLSSQESGLVFLPTFNRRTRRDLSTEKPKSVEDSTKQQDVEEQESGLVFLPSFGRRTRRFV